MQITRNSTNDGGAERVVHRRGLPRRGRRAVGRLAPEREQRPLHARRTHRLAHAPERPDDLRPEGVGLAQRRGGPVEVIRPGDRVFFEPGEEHWHGAAATRFMTHLALLHVDEEGNSATWGAHVTRRGVRGSARERRLRRRGSPGSLP